MSAARDDLEALCETYCVDGVHAAELARALASIGWRGPWSPDDEDDER